MLKNSDIAFEGMVDRNFPNNISSAKEIVPLLVKAINPKSVTDVGCGMGQWLYIFNKNGVKNIKGIDGNWLKDKNILLEKEQIIYHDLENCSGLKIEKSDLAVSLEVAEHISEQQANNFVDFLVSIADVVYFSAATPYSGGVHHVNEKWQMYWIRKFAKRGYKAIDYIRPKIWNNRKVCYFYKEESFIFVKEAALDKYPILKNYVQEPIFDLVHPVHFTDQVIKPTHEWSYLLEIQRRLLISYKQKVQNEFFRCRRYCNHEKKILNGLYKCYKNWTYK